MNQGLVTNHYQYILLIDRYLPTILMKKNMKVRLVAMTYPDLKPMLYKCSNVTLTQSNVAWQGFEHIMKDLFFLPCNKFLDSNLC